MNDYIKVNTIYSKEIIEGGLKKYIPVDSGDIVYINKNIIEKLVYRDNETVIFTINNDMIRTKDNIDELLSNLDNPTTK